MKEGNVLFNDTLIFYLQLYVIERMVKDYATTWATLSD